METICLVIVALVGTMLIGTGYAQLKDPPRNFTRLTSFNCIFYPHAFRCHTDRTCIPAELVHNGIAECADGSDELPDVNICDYAPYFPDYRCSLYADCLRLPDGYSCRCKKGYVGPGEFCQPAPLNAALFLTTPRPLVIQTVNTNTTPTSLLELSNDILKANRARDFDTAVTDGRDKAQDVFWGVFRRQSNYNRPMNTREVRNDTTTIAAKATLGSTGVRISGSDVGIPCPNNSLLINDSSSQIWCLKITDGRVEYPTRSSSSPVVFTTFESNSSPPGITNTFKSLTSPSAGDLARKIAAMLSKAPQTEYTTMASTYDKMVDSKTDDTIPTTLEAQTRGLTGVPAGVGGITGITEDGAIFGYMPVSATSREPFDLSVNNTTPVQLTRGSIITPVKIWNATGGAFVAYRITPNASLPESCLMGTTQMFMCAARDTCVTPDKLMDLIEDCSDGSDEVPEFLDECAFGTDWPQYQCGANTGCIDTAPGYLCKCVEGFYWDGNLNACSSILSNSSLTLLAQTINNTGGPIVPLSTAGSANSSNNSADPKKSKDGTIPIGIYVTVHPGWSSSAVLYTKDLLQLVPSLNGSSSLNNVRRPNVLCLDCISPAMVTLGPVGNPSKNKAGGGREDDLAPPAIQTDTANALPETIVSGASSVSANYVLSSQAQPRTPAPLTDVFTGTYPPSAGDSSVVATTTIPSAWRGLKLTPQQGSTQDAPGYGSSTSLWDEVLAAMTRVNNQQMRTTPSPLSSPSFVTNPAGTILNLAAAGNLFGTMESTRTPISNVPLTTVTSRGGAASITLRTTLTPGRAAAAQPATPAAFGQTSTPRLDSGVTLQGTNFGLLVANRFTTIAPSSHIAGVTLSATGVTLPVHSDIATANTLNTVLSAANNMGRQPPANSLDAQSTSGSVHWPTLSSFAWSFVSSPTTAGPTNTLPPTGTTRWSNPFVTRPPSEFTTVDLLDVEVVTVRQATGLVSTSSSAVDPQQETALDKPRGTDSSGSLDNSGILEAGNLTVVSLDASGNLTVEYSNPNAITSVKNSSQQVPGSVIDSGSWSVLPGSPLILGSSTVSSITGLRVNASPSSATALSRSDDVSGNYSTNSTASVTLVPSRNVSVAANNARAARANYSTDVFWRVPPRNQSLPVLPPLMGNQPISPNYTTVVGRNSNNSSMIPLDQLYDCFNGSFQTAYNALYNNTKRCDRSCDVNKTEQCIYSTGRCECLPGLSRSGPRGECQQSLQYKVGLTMTQLCGKPLEFQDYLRDMSDPMTQQLAVIVCYQMEQLIRNSSVGSRYSPGSCHPIDFSRGSVASNVGVSFFSRPGGESALPSEVINALGDSVATRQGFVGDDARSALQVRSTGQGNQTQGTTYALFIGDVSECDLSLPNFPVCSRNADCRNSFGTFSCTCRPGFVDSNPSFPGRNCDFPGITATIINGTANSCSSDYYRFASLCLHPAYFILLIIAFIIAGILILLLIGCLIACCCRCCKRKQSEYDVPQVALIRAAARSPRSNVVESSNGNYQVLKSVDSSALDPNGPRPTAPPPPGPKLDLEQGLQPEKYMDGAPNADLNRTQSAQDVSTFEEVEVPSFRSRDDLQDDGGSKRALSPSQGSTFSRAAKLGEIPKQSNIEETTVISDALLQRSEATRELEVPQISPRQNSIGSSGNLTRTDYELPPSPSQSFKALASAKHIAKKYHLEAQNSLRKASTETREWLAIPRTESLVMDDELDVDTLPDTSYHKDPVYQMMSPIPGTETKFDDKDLLRLGMGYRDSFDDVMEQTSRFYQQSSSDVEYEKEGALNLKSDDDKLEKNKDGKDGPGDGGQGSQGGLQRTPAYFIPPRGSMDDPLADSDYEEPGGGGKDPAQDDDDHQSLKSMEEEELQDLRGSLASLKSLKVNVESHDSVIDQIVDEQPVFYSPTNSSDDENYFQRKSALTQRNSDAHAQKDTMSVPEGAGRKFSAEMREIAINEFGALGERDSIDDLLDQTTAFFSRASTVESFQNLPKTNESGEETAPGSRKASSSFLGVDGSAGIENSPRRRPLLKKRSAFHSRESMNKIMETTTNTDESGTGSVDQEAGVSSRSPDQLRSRPASAEGASGQHVQKTEPRSRPGSAGDSAVRDAETSPPRSLPGAEGTSFRGSDTSEPPNISGEAIMLDDEDIDEFFAHPDGEAAPSVAERTDRETGQLLDDNMESVREAEDPPPQSAMLQRNEPEHHEGDPHSRSVGSREHFADSPDIKIGEYQEPEVISGRGRRGTNEKLADETAADNKSVKSVSDQNLQIREGESSQAIIPHDSDSGVYVDNGHVERSSSGSHRQAMASQDDLQVFEGQAQREGSGSSYQRLSQSDDEEEVMKRYSAAYETNVRKTKRVRHNYEMGPPESRHVYYTSRPKRMPPNREEMDVWKESTWWRNQPRK